MYCTDNFMDFRKDSAILYPKPLIFLQAEIRRRIILLEPELYHVELPAIWLIDIKWLDWAYKSSTCDVMDRRQRRHLYYGGQI
jgi:hypothetical protein